MCGVRDIRIQRRLLAEPKSTLKRALDLALAIEAADKDTSEIHKADGQGGDASANKVDVNVNKASKVQCSRCGGNHCTKSCCFKDANCYCCGKVGHLARLCPARKKGKQPQPVSEQKQATTSQPIFLKVPCKHNFYGKFILNLSSILEPLHSFAKEDVVWKWEVEQQEAFDKGKNQLQSSDALVHYDPEKELVVSCDASPYCVGAVLSHVLEDGSERPVAYTWRTLSTAETNYGHPEKEAPAVVFAVKSSTNFCMVAILRFRQTTFGAATPLKKPRL